MKAKIIGVVVVIVILLCSGVGYFLYQRNVRQKAIDKKIEEISEVEKKFSASEKREDKINILKNILADMDEYNKSKDKYKEVSEKYESVVSNMRGAFSKEYDTSIKENTIDDIGNLEDIETINANKDNLNKLLSLIESEKKYTFSKESESGQYIQKIDSLIESYSNRIEVLEEAQKKAEEEAQKKAEEEAQRKAEEERAKTHYENEYFSVDVPTDWNEWSIAPGENYRQNSNAIAVYDCSMGKGEFGGGAEIYVLEIKYPETDRLGYGNFILPDGGTYVGQTTNGKFVFIMTEAGAGFFSHGATITLK